MFSFPNGQPTQLQPLVAEDITLHIMDVGATHDPATVQLRARFGNSGDFDAYAATALGNGDYQATLPGTPCGCTLQYYFSVDTLSGQTVHSPADAPATTYELTAAPLSVVLDEDLSTDPGWTAEGLWEWGQPTGDGGNYGDPDPSSGHTGSYVYGYNLSGDYESSLDETSLTTPTLDCTGVYGAELTFWRWLGVEQPSYDHAYVRINDGSGWSNLWQNTEEVDDGAWVYQEFDISAYADDNANVQIRWTMGTTDGSWQYCGWNIDDIVISAVDPAGCAVAPADMNCDGQINFDDIDGFVLALVGEGTYYDSYLNCNWLNADVNGDDIVNFDDIDGFVEALVGS